MRAGVIDVLPWLRSIRPVLTVVDPLAVVLAGALVSNHATLAAVAAAALAATVVCRGADLHRSRLVLSVVDDLPRLGLAALVAGLVLGALTPGRSTDQLWLVVFTGGAFLLLVLLRSVVYAVVHSRRRSGRSSHPVVVVGAGAVGRRLATTFEHRREYGLEPVGIIDTAPDLTARTLPVPLLGGIEDLERVMADLGVDDVVFAFPDPPDDRTIDVVRRCVQADHQVFVVPRFFEMMGVDHHRRTEVIGDVAVMRLRRWGLRPHTLLLKRLLDIVVSTVALVLLAPVLAACALAVRLETGPGVIFRQVRVGRGGRTFTLFKFRSLKPVDEDESATQWSIDHDARLGPVGRFLRRTSLDELPQLVNVLRGDMSLVGPRPERPFFVREFARTELRYDDRHRVQTGLTGYAQVHDLRGDTAIDARVRFDNYYIENWSLWADIKIMARTVRAVFRGEPATSGIDLSPGANPLREQPRPERRTLPHGRPHVLHVSVPTTEGVANVLLGYVRDQLARGWSVTVACPEQGWLGPAARKAGAEVLVWEATRSPGPRVLGETRRLRRIVDAVDPDVVHLHSAKAGMAGRLAVRGRRPTVFQPHAWSFDAVRGPVRAASIVWERWAQRWTTELVCVSLSERLAGERHGIHAPVTLALNGVDLDRFEVATEAERRSARARLELPDAPTVVCVGRLAEQKGQHDLLDAWPQVLDRVPDAQLVLIGDGPDRDGLQARGRELDGVQLVGNRPDVRDWLAASDVVAAPSRWEGMAVAPLEAMAAGRSVVATRVTGMVESIPRGAGALVAVGDPAALADAVARRLVDRSLAAAEGRQGRMHVEAHHDADASAEHVARVTLRRYWRSHGLGDALTALQPMVTRVPRPSARTDSPAAPPTVRPTARPTARPTVAPEGAATVDALWAAPADAVVVGTVVDADTPSSPVVPPVPLPRTDPTP
ncbi:exopolysaccharide biosynthesis polyprenyl glycosylphosphotransferase [Nocardioides sp.]|uniref:exopolysaccharide biosynthesis polyprenyl glycosylphosphotransferase n=1 Tax=Nocardioides sp. TaxID=35761 RepID=UPI0037840B25